MAVASAEQSGSPELYMSIAYGVCESQHITSSIQLHETFYFMMLGHAAPSVQLRPGGPSLALTPALRWCYSASQQGVMCHVSGRNSPQPSHCWPHGATVAPTRPSVRASAPPGNGPRRHSEARQRHAGGPTRGDSAQTVTPLTRPHESRYWCRQSNLTTRAGPVCWGSFRLRLACFPAGRAEDRSATVAPPAGG